MNTARARINYAWVVVAACFLMTFCALGLNSNCLSVFVPALIARLDLSRAQGSAVLSAQSLVSIVSIWVAGMLFRRFSVRRVKYIFALCGVCGFVVMGFSRTLAVCYLGAALTGVALSGALMPATTLINRWFHERRGTAMGIVMVGSSVASLIFSPVLTGMIARWGVSAAFLATAGVMLLLETVAFVLVRDWPEDKGLQPYGEEPEAEDAAGAPREEPGATLGQAVRSGRFYVLIVANLLLGFTVLPSYNHVYSYVHASGYAPMVAAGIFSMMGGLNLVSKPLYGVLKDRMGTRRSNSLIFCVFILGLVSAVLVPMGVGMACLFGVVFVFGMPMGTMSRTFWIVDMFGTRNYSTIYAYIMIFSQVGNTLGLATFGLVADLTGTYLHGYLIGAALMVLCFGMVQMMYRGARRNPAPWNNGEQRR